MATATKNGSDPVAGTQPQIQLKPLQKHQVDVTVRGITPVIPHKWSAKAIRLMREAQSGSKVKAKHDPKVAEEEAEGSCYYLPDGVTPGLTAVSFKAAIIGACRLFQGITMASAKTAFHVIGEGPDQLVAITGVNGEPYERTIREDLPRNSNGSPDLRYRYAYFPWECVLPITFLPSQVDLESVLALVNAAGLGGVGDWRPSAPKSLTGTFGQFEIATDVPSKVTELGSTFAVEQ